MLRRLFFEDDGTFYVGWIGVAIVFGITAVVIAAVFAAPVINWSFQTWSEKWEFKPAHPAAAEIQEPGVKS